MKKDQVSPGGSEHKLEAYKIRFPNQKYSGGKSEPKQAPRGKVWSSKQALSSHITLVTETWAESDYQKPLILGPHPYEGAAILDLVRGASQPVDVKLSVEKLIAKIEGRYLGYHRSTDVTEKIRALQEYLKHHE